MGAINPITDRQVLEKMREYLRERNLRNYLLFRVGLNLGLSVQDLLELRIEDVVDKEVFIFRKCNINISPSLQREIRNFVGNEKTGYLFTTSKGTLISRFQLYMILRNAAQAAGYEEAIGALTLRKTFAYWAYREKAMHLPTLCSYLNHHSVEYTLDYLGIEEKQSLTGTMTAIDL